MVKAPVPADDNAKADGSGDCADTKTCGKEGAKNWLVTAVPHLPTQPYTILHKITLFLMDRD